MGKFITKEQRKTLSALADKIDDFYLAGGTALSLFYLNHRESDDLDFFTQQFNFERVKDIIDYLAQCLKNKITLIAENLSPGKAEVMIYNIEFNENTFLKIDFVRDVLPLIKPTNTYDGVKILSVEDIYLRKLYAASGLRIELDEVGRSHFVGGRQEAKDLFDIYFLSLEHIRLSDFVNKYCGQTLKEGVIRWFRTFNRIEMKADLADIKTDKPIEFREIDKHISIEIDTILSREVDLQ